MDNWYVRLASISALGAIGPEAKPAIPAMIEVLEVFLHPTAEQLKIDAQNGQNFIRSSKSRFLLVLSSALAKIDPGLKDTIPDVRTNLKGFLLSTEKDAVLWQKAYESLKEKYPMQTTVPPTDRQSKEGTDRDAAPKTEIGKKDQGPLYRGKPASYWMGQFKDADPKLRVEALVALGNIAQKNKKLIPVLVDSLKDKDDKVGIVALKALGSLGPDAKSAIPIMIDLLGDFLKSADINSWSKSDDIFTVDFSQHDFPRVLAYALKKIDPEIKQIQDFPPQPGKGKTLNEAKQALLSQWQKAYETLRKSYPTQRPPLPSNQQSKEGIAGALALMEEAMAGMFWVKGKAVLMVTALGLAVGGASWAGIGGGGEKSQPVLVGKEQRPSDKDKVQATGKKPLVKTDL